jgi:hypothetical protein
MDDTLRASDPLARQLATTAVQREHIRASGLLALTIAEEFGGPGAD